MKILYVATVSNTVNAFLIPHIRLLVDMGHQVDVACNFVQEVNAELILLGCRFHQVDFQRSPLKIDNVRAYRRIKKLVKDGGYEIIHTHTPVASLITRIACRDLIGVKILYTAHGFHFYKGAPMKNWLLYYTLEKIAARWTDGIITINDEDRETATRFKLRRNGAIYKVCGVGIDLNKYLPQTNENKIRYRDKFGYEKNDFILFYAAELNRNKHQDLLIHVVKRLKNDIPHIKLLLAGAGDLSETYMRLVENLDVANHVVFLGFRNDVQELLQLSDLVVSASRREGLPVNILEAMASGLPLVVTNTRGNRDLVENDENGYIVGVDDVDGFVTAVKKIYESEWLRSKFASQSLEKVYYYSKEHALQEIESLYCKYVD